MKISHIKFEEKLKELDADRVNSMWVWDRANGKNIKVKRTYGEFTQVKAGSSVIRVRAEYQADRVTCVIISNSLGNIYLPKSEDIETVIALFEKVKTLKAFVGDIS